MKRTGAALACVAALLASGCATTGGSALIPPAPEVKVVQGFYDPSSSGAIDGDIRGILAAGGLDARNPAAATGDTRPSEIAEAPASDVAEVARLVAGMKAVEEPAARAVPPLAMVSAAAVPAAVQATVHTAGPDTSVTFVYPEIGAAAPSSPPAAAQPPAARAAEPARTRSRQPSPRRADAAAAPVPEQRPTAVAANVPRRF